MLDVLNIWKREYGPGAMTPVQEEVIRHIMRGWKVVVSPRLRERREGRTLYVRPERLPRALAWLRGWACFEVPEASQDVPVPAEASPENYLVRQKRLHRNAYAKWPPSSPATKEP